MTQLAAYIESHSATLELSRGKSFVVEGITGEGELALATFKSAKASYLGVVAVRNDLVAGRPGAELWSIVGGRRTIARFAIWKGTLINVS